MDSDAPTHTEAVQVSTLVTLSVREKLRARARKNGQGLQDFLRAMIVRELGYAGDAAPPAVEPEPRDVVAAPKPLPKLERQSTGSVLDLIGRGFTVSQVAAMKRMPYRTVMEELGRQVDRKAARMELP